MLIDALSLRSIRGRRFIVPEDGEKMGLDSASVVDQELRVRGHANAPSIVFREKTAEPLLAEPVAAKVPGQ